MCLPTFLQIEKLLDRPTGSISSSDSDIRYDDSSVPLNSNKVPIPLNSNKVPNSESGEGGVM